MGNSPNNVKDAFKDYVKQEEIDDDQRLFFNDHFMFEHDLIDKLYERVKSAMSVSIDSEKVYKTNEQKDDEEAGSLSNLQLLHELNENYASGFSTPEHSINNLKNPAYEKFFSVQTNDSTKDQNSIMHKRMVVLYALYLEGVKEHGKKETLYEYLNHFLEEDDDLDPRLELSLSTGLKFTIALLKEIKNISPALLESSLENLHQALVNSKPEALFDRDKTSFVTDANLNDARALIVNLILDEKSSNKVIELCYKILLLCGLSRANPEDYLIAASLLEQNPRQINLKEEIGLINKAYEKSQF